MTDTPRTSEQETAIESLVDVIYTRALGFDRQMGTIRCEHGFHHHPGPHACDWVNHDDQCPHHLDEPSPDDQ